MQVCGREVNSRKTKKGYIEKDSKSQNTPIEALEKKYEEKYKDLDNEDASSLYYDDGNAMDCVLGELQEGIDKAIEKYGKIKSDYEDPSVEIYIDEDNYEISFSIDDDVFYTHFVGESMADALVLTGKMEESGTSTGISQAINNWAEDLSFSGLGNYHVSDSWDLLEGFEGYEDDDEDKYDYDDEDNDEDNEDGDEDYIPTGSCHSENVMNKHTLQTIQICYEEKDLKLVAADFSDAVTVFEYDSTAAVCDAVLKFKDMVSASNDYVCESSEMPFGIDHLIRSYESNPHLDVQFKGGAPADISTLFRAKGELSSAEKKMEKELEQELKIPCRRLVFFQTLSDMEVWICDEAGRRILDPSGSGKYLSEYKTDEETVAALEQLKSKFMKKGYELLLEDTIEYHFEYSLKMIKRYS